MQRRALAAALALACVAALAAVPLPVSAHINDVRADAQVSAEGTMLVETAYVADDAWLAVYRDDDGSRGEVIGTRRLDGAGFRTDFAVSIDEAAWSDWPEGEARTVHVALHDDRGGGFDREEDPILTSFGREAADRFILERGPGAYVGTRGFSPQETDGPSVTVRTARLPADGYVVARNVSDAGSPNETALEPVGATALDAGTHENVTIELNESYYERQGARPRLGITVYADDGDGAFGAGDEPVRAGEAPVTTFLFLNRTDASGGGGTDDGGSAVTTATATDEDGGLVTTATASATASASAEPTTPPDGEGSTGDGSTSTDSTSTGGQPGFGALAAGLALVVALAAGARRRRT